MKKFSFWVTALSFAFLSLIILWAVLERVFYSLPDTRVQALGYQVAGVLIFLGIAGIAIGIKMMKKKPGLAAGLIGFFFTPLALGIAAFIFGP